MKYINGQEIQLGDRVTADGAKGVIISVIESDVESPQKRKWEFLKKGVLVETDEMGLVHYPEPDEDLVLVGRSSENPP